MTDATLTPVHPGEILRRDFLLPMGITQKRLAEDVSVPAARISEIANGKRGMTAEIAIRLARYFGTTERFWLNLQVQYELDTAHDRLGDRIDGVITLRPP